MIDVPSCKYANETPLCVVPISIPIAILEGPSHGPWNTLGAALTDPLVFMPYGNSRRLVRATVYQTEIQRPRRDIT